MIRHRQWRGWQFGRRHKNVDMFDDMVTSDNDFDIPLTLKNFLIVVAIGILLCTIMIYLPKLFGFLVVIALFGNLIRLIIKIFF